MSKIRFFGAKRDDSERRESWLRETFLPTAYSRKRQLCSLSPHLRFAAIFFASSMNSSSFWIRRAVGVQFTR